MKTPQIKTLVIIAILVTWVLSADSHYQKGGVDYSYAWVVIISAILNLIYVLPIKTKWSIKLLFAIPVSLLLIFVQNMILTPAIVYLLYKDKTWFLWEFGPRITINTFHYGFCLLLFIVLLKGCYKFELTCRGEVAA